MFTLCPCSTLPLHKMFGYYVYCFKEQPTPYSIGDLPAAVKNIADCAEVTSQGSWLGNPFWTSLVCEPWGCTWKI